MSSLRAFPVACCLVVALACSSVSAQLTPVDPAAAPVVGSDAVPPPARVAAPPAPPRASMDDAWLEYVRAQELVRLRVQVDLLRESRRELLLPAIVLGAGVASLVVGGIVFASAWRGPEDHSVVGDRAGLVMMPVGAALTLIGGPWLAVRLSRSLRLQRAERALRALQQR